MGEGSVFHLEKVITDQGSPSDATTPGVRSRGTGDSPARGICLQITCWLSGEEGSGQRTALSTPASALCSGIRDCPHAAPPD